MLKRFTKAIFSPQPQIQKDIIKLDDPVFVYNDGLKSKVISLDIARHYPVIHDKYYHDDETVSDVSVIICPYTLFAIVLSDIWYPTDQVFNNNIIVKKGSITYIPIKNEFSDVIANIRRYEIRLMTHKNELMQYHDSLYLDIMIDNQPLTSKDYYYFQDTHNTEKQLIYIIEYKSKEKLKNTILIPKYNTFDITKNGLDTYLSKYEEDIRNKTGYILQCYSFAWPFKDNKVIKL